MYLKRLELQGFKSFARKTEFVFEHGITAIVGPNGTGKSNIADAVRWALGETRMSQLRAKVTDDLIFAGSDSRARLGMAQVAMTLDNSDDTLPIDYSEVTIERRAYRDGQNEYLINGTKVRLRDIVELLGAGGLTRDAYSVIGQGLVDTVLSLRPQERRGLIDVAAGIRPLQDKRDRALSQLEETRDNLTRVRDIAAEIEPRLRRLGKQAERARQGAEVATELAEALETWYGYQWHAGQQALREARAAAEAARQTLAQRREAVASLEERIESRRDREEAQADALSELREQRAELRGRYEAVRRDLAVRQERLTLLQRRQEELAQEIDDLREQREQQQRQLSETEAALTQLDKQRENLQAQVESLQQRQAGVQQRKVEYEFALEGARQKAFEAASDLSDNRNRLATLQEREAELRRERAAQDDAVAELASEVENRRAALDDARQRAEEHEQALRQLAREREENQAALQAATNRLEALQEKSEDARRQLERLQARREALAEARPAGSGDAAGAQALLDADSELSGIIGSVASLIRVPAEYETAIEAALGPNLHAVVVKTWADAKRAIAWLQDNDAGRATLIALSEIRAPAGPEGAREPGGDRVVDVAAKLVACEPRFERLVRRLLGDTIVVEELGTIQKAPSESVTFVSRDGTVVGSNGRIVGGSAASNVLRRERLWRELPAQIEAAEAEVARLESERAGARAAVDTLTRRLAESEERAKQTRSALAEMQAAVEEAQRDIEAAEREIDWRRGVLEQRSEELRAVEERIGQLEDEIAQIRARHEQAQRRVGSLQAQLDELDRETLREASAQAEKELALTQRDWQNQQTRQQDLRSALSGTERQIESKQTRIDALSAETEALRGRVEGLEGEERRFAEKLAALEDEIAPAEDALRTMRREGRDLEREAARARDLLHQAETSLAEANLDVQRREDRLTSLRDKIADDLELAAVSEDLPRQLMLELEGEVEELPVVTEVPEGLDRRVKRLRRQMRELGSASPELIAEYEETKARYEFLTSQAADLEEAAADLRAVAGELTEIMSERFSATFEQVAGAFEGYFKRFFGGGEAHLSLIQDEEDAGDPGLDVVARPPGKRSQSLALLSGGERALTAVALLFSLLEVSPTPFCVLDEVDAMLDEANIGRFRSTLEELAEETQFVIITHNRGTIQAADTLYGISMSDTGVSQAISLKLTELEPVPA